jgi:hypothetical protein
MNYIVLYLSDINECGSGPCQNGGRCTDLINEFNCSCVVGYTGLVCDAGNTLNLKNVIVKNATIVVLFLAVNVNNDVVCYYNISDIDDCNPITCQNGGTCTDLVNGFNCSCMSGYNGSTCETGDIQ